MPNVLRSTLSILRAEFVVGIFQSLLWLGGYSLLFWTNWKIALGILMVMWAAELRQSERARP